MTSEITTVGQLVSAIFGTILIIGALLGFIGTLIGLPSGIILFIVAGKKPDDEKKKKRKLALIFAIVGPALLLLSGIGWVAMVLIQAFLGIQV